MDIIKQSAMGPSWRDFICGDASRAIFLAKQKNSGWSGISQTPINTRVIMGADFSWLVTGHFWLVTLEKHALFYVSEII